MSDTKLITFEPLDSLFFREAKPFNAGEGGFLDSQFPPPAQTLSGAIRGAIGEANNVNWNDKAAVKTLLGTADDPSPHSFAGPYLLKNGQRLYPVPLNLLYSEKERKWTRLVPSVSPFITDMGNWKLPEPEKQSEGTKPLEGAKPIEEGWLDVANMQEVLNGGVPADFIPTGKIIVREARAGIGRDNRKSVVNEGQLYFTRHLRLNLGFTLGMGVGGGDLPDGGMVRLGGEGRLARIVVGAMPASLADPTVDGDPQGLILTLLTHGDFGGKVEPDWSSVCPGMELISACVGKPVPEGGWDYANRHPKPLKSLVPAGSCYFVKAKNCNLADVIAELHGKYIGQRTSFGYGEIAVGIWK
jgi:CRISPR-associated protein Cmr3